MKYCPKCGTPTEDQNQFCINCGSQFPNQSLSQAQSPLVQTSPASQNSDSKKKGLAWIAALAAVLIIAVAVLFATGVIENPFPNDEEAYEDDEERVGTKERNRDGEQEESGLEAFAADLKDIIEGVERSYGSKAAPSDTPDFDNNGSAPIGGTDDFTYDGSGGTITVWASTDMVGNMLEQYANPALPNITTDFVLIPYEDYQNKIAAALAADDLPDILVVESIDAKTVIDSGTALDLSDLENQARSVEMVPYVLDYGRDSNGTLRAYSWECNPGAMFYRRSLARNYLGTDDPEKIQEMVSTINGLYQTASQLDIASGGKCKLTSLNDMSLPARSSRSQPWVSNNKLMTVEADYLQTLCSMNNEGYLADIIQWDTAWFDGISDEAVDSSGNPIEVFSYFLPPWGMEFVLKENAKGASDTTGDWGIVKGPYDYFWGGMWICADANTSNEQAVKALIQYLTMDEGFLESWAVDNHRIVSSNKVNRRIVELGVEPFLSGQNAFEQYINIADKVNGTIFTSYDKVIDRCWDDSIRDLFYNDMPVNEVVETFKNNVRESLPDLVVE